jgi:hypothetical protein
MGCGKGQGEVVVRGEARMSNKGRINYACRGHCHLATMFVLEELMKENEETEKRN